MFFHSQTFIFAFLPVVLGVYYALARNERLRHWWIIAASLVFYGWWDVRFLPLLIGQSAGSWLLAELHFRTRRRWPLIVAIAANFAALACFKYLDFTIGLIEGATGVPLPRSGLILPIGISFYTFQIVSYLIDALRGQAPRYELRRLMLFVVLFPHLIAGPIVRHSEIIPQFSLDPLRPDAAERVSRGLAMFVIAIAIKIFLADKLSLLVEPVFQKAAGQVPPLWDAATAFVAFPLQIFFDFASYTDMAIGLALTMGFSFPQNFNQPYRALSIRDFWRRWHMTLSRFLRDYLYIPLGGSRHGPVVFAWATMATMGLCGLWHGAGVTFVAWGLLHGAGLLVCRAWETLQRPLPTLLSWPLTFGFVAVLFTFFRAPDFPTAMNALMGLTATTGLGAAPGQDAIIPLVAGFGLALMPASPASLVQRYLRPSRLIALLLALLAAYILLELGNGAPKNFIYFQF